MQDQPPGDDPDVDDTTTPIDLDSRRPEVPLGGAWRGLERAVLGTLDRVRTARLNWGEAGPDHRAALAWGLADTFREFADAAHDLARQLEDFARRHTG